MLKKGLHMPRVVRMVLDLADESALTKSKKRRYPPREPVHLCAPWDVPAH